MLDCRDYSHYLFFVNNRTEQANTRNTTLKKLHCLVTMLVLGAFCTLGFAQDLDKPLPTDSNITIGKIDNGITYYIRYNKKPEKRAELRLAVNAGSILESDGQLGLAHFVEHMGFNGTRNFKKQQLVNFMESIGMRFGPEVNAYTSFDETVYILTIPTDSTHIIERAFDILEDWSHFVAFEGEEIDKERGVIIEEWRLGRGAEMRMFDKQLPIILKDSRYAERLPIGNKKTLETFKHDTLRQFYQTWYRPDLIAVVAVGDFDKSTVEQLIRKHFSAIVRPSTELKRPAYPVPDNEEPLFAIATDPEATSSRITIYHKQEVIPEKTVGDYRKKLVGWLYNGMLNNRLNELTRQSDPPFLGAFSQHGSFVRTKDAYSLGAVVKNNGIEHGLEVLLTEAARVRTFGFTKTEFDREKKSMLRQMEQAFNERDKTESASFADEYVRNFLTAEPIPGIESEFEMQKRLLPTITLEEVNKLAGEWITERNRVIAVNAPEKQDVHVPSRDELTKVFAAVAKKEITPYVDRASTQPLVPTPPKGAIVAEQSEINELGITEWRLSNGVRVILRPTDFKNDEVLFTAFSPGGTSLVPDKDYTAASTATSVIQEGGAGAFDLITLQKMLAGKIVQVSPYIGELNEGLSGSASPADLETMFQLIYLYCTSPRMDSTAFQSFKTRMKGFIQNRSARPESAFEDTVQVTMTQHNFRRRPISEAILDEMNLQTSFNVYRDRFADASDFTFVFVGAFKPPALEPLVKTYLAGLPSLSRNETWRDLGITPPTGFIDKNVKKGIEPKSSVRMVFTGPFSWSAKERYAMNSLAGVLRIKLREALREEKGGTYGVTVSGTPAHYPRPEYRITISFGCAPERVEELTKTALEQVDSVKHFGTTTDYVNKVKEIQRRERETNLKENRFWLNTLQFYYANAEDPKQLLEYDALIDKLSTETVHKAAQKYLEMKNYARFVLSPQ